MYFAVNVDVVGRTYMSLVGVVKDGPALLTICWTYIQRIQMKVQRNVSSLECLCETMASLHTCHVMKQCNQLDQDLVHLSIWIFFFQLPG